MATVAEELRAEAKRELIIIHDDRFWLSVGRDVFSAGMLIALISVGVAVNSSALQWLGGIVWMMWLFARAQGRRHFMTVAEARTRLDEIDARAKGGSDAS